MSGICVKYRLMTKRKEWNVLFNYALNIFYLRLYGVRHMVKDHSDSERGNPLPPLNVLLFPISNKGSFYAPSQRQDSTYNGLCYTSHGALAVTRKCLKYTYNCYFHCYAKRVCGMMHIKEPILLIENSSPRSGGSGFPLSLSAWSFK